MHKSHKIDTKRQLWIDILKGIGILSIIFVHTTDKKGVFIYAVPLFFMLSGYLHKPMKDLTSFLMKSVRRMLIPYIAFFILISFFRVFTADNHLAAITEHTTILLWGGNRMVGDFGVFWFVNVLFIGTNIFNYMQVKHFPFYAFLILFLLSNCLFLCNNINLPYNVQSLPIALSYMYIGSIIKQRWDSISSVNKCVAGGVIVLTTICIPNIYLDIKQNDYGIPILSFALSIVTVMALGIISVKLESCHYITVFLAYCGKASLFLMFIHQFIHFRLHSVTNVYIVFVLTVLLSLFSYFVSYKFHFCRKFLCGES